MTLRLDLTLSTILFAAFATCLTGQGKVGPFTLQPSSPAYGLDPYALGVQSVEAIDLVQLPGQPSGEAYCCLTVRGLSGTYGGVGGLDIWCGTYHTTFDQFVPNTHNAHPTLPINSSGTEFGMKVHHTGKWAVVDRINKLPLLLHRNNLADPWQERGPIDVGPSAYYDPCLADWKGETWFFWVDTQVGPSISGAPIDLSNGTVDMSRSKVFVFGAKANSTPNSPTPILDSNQEVTGFYHHDTAGGDNDLYMTTDLDPGSPSLLVEDSPGWTNNGSILGGRFYQSNGGVWPPRIDMQDLYWVAGKEAAIGTMTEATAYVPPEPAWVTMPTSVFYVGFNHLSTPITLPFLNNSLGINGFVLVGADRHDNATGAARFQVQIPNQPQLQGQSFPMQTVMLHYGRITLSNTTDMSIR